MGLLLLLLLEGNDGEGVVAGAFCRRMSVSRKSSMSPSLGSERSLSDTSSIRGCDIVGGWMDGWMDG